MIAIRCFRLAALYLIVGMSLGVFMGATQQSALAPVHAHINLLGWVLLVLAGLLFTRFPHLAVTGCGRAFFWIYNFALPISMVLLALEMTGHHEVGPALGISSVGVWLGGMFLATNILFNLRLADITPQAAEHLHDG